MTKKQVGEERIYSAYISTLLFVVIIKRERAIRICSGRVWGKGVPQWAHAKASLPPEEPATRWIV